MALPMLECSYPECEETVREGSQAIAGWLLLTQRGVSVRVLLCPKHRDQWHAFSTPQVGATNPSSLQPPGLESLTRGDG